MKVVKNKDPRLCQAYGCKRLKGNHRRFCDKHHMRYQKEHNPIGYTFNTLRENARRRGKKFTLTIDQFRQFCEETNYIEKKGKTCRKASIDRIDPNKGYEIGNIQLLTVGQNSSKSWVDGSRGEALEEEKCPF